MIRPRAVGAGSSSQRRHPAMSRAWSSGQQIESVGSGRGRGAPDAPCRALAAAASVIAAARNSADRSRAGVPRAHGSRAERRGDREVDGAAEGREGQRIAAAARDRRCPGRIPAGSARAMWCSRAGEGDQGVHAHDALRLDTRCSGGAACVAALAQKLVRPDYTGTQPEWYDGSNRIKPMLAIRSRQHGYGRQRRNLSSSFSR